MQVICFYWQGDRWQQEGYKAPEGHVNLQEKTMSRWGKMDDKLPVRYINNLYNGVKRFASSKIEFICFTNEKLEGLEKRVQVRQFPMITQHGVLPRLFMFSREAGLKGQVLVLDLDVVIVGSLGAIMGYNGEFCTRSKFKPNERHKLDGDIMSFQAGKKTEERFWKPFVNDVDKSLEITQGRERYWVRHVASDIAERWDKVAPNNVISYKWHVYRNQRKIPSKAAIVSCHGYPRPHQIKENEPIRQYWK